MVDEEEGLDRLYGLPLGEFTRARDRLAADLREQGDHQAASRVKALRRPTVPAWVVNQLARSHPDDVHELMSVRDDLRAAQRAALSGGGAAGIREIGERRRRVMDRLLDVAGGLLAEGGHAASRSTLDRVGDTLMAATMDDEAAEAVRRGRLTRELTPPSGFDSLTGELPDRAESAPARDRAARARTRRAADEARAAEDAAEEAERQARRLEQEAERSRKEAERARRKADRAALRAVARRREADELRRGEQP